MGADVVRAASHVASRVGTLRQAQRRVDDLAACVALPAPLSLPKSAHAGRPRLAAWAKADAAQTHESMLLWPPLPTLRRLERGIIPKIRTAALGCQRGCVAASRRRAPNP
jgi:hypothetical protein